MAVAILLLLFCVIPGVVYLVVSRKTITEPFSVQVTPDGDGSKVTMVGRGEGYVAARRAVMQLS